ncbi:MAG: crotonase/enoyl-CoA hydratase family protein [Acidimicrobiales bacterium]|nr:crotonase/enoyl-CoA hydratase family protein [Acidimicrobiales bacterium]MCB1015412.1 crotonase/enoyl-CoA hydratase family protein [Acidimicrobiales bacterium]
MTTAGVSYELDGSVAIIGLDDGKANAISHDLVDALHAALDRAESEARAVVIVGREGRFSAGFHLPTMTAGTDEMRGLVTAGAELLLRLYLFPRPVVVACTGHALAAGALLLLVADVRVGAAGDFKVGLNEVAIGMQLPIFAVELARDRLLPTAFTAATLGARLYGPDDAAAVGYLDRVVAPDQLVPTAREAAAELAELRTGAFAETKERARSTTVDFARATLAEDMASIEVPQP